MYANVRGLKSKLRDIYFNILQMFMALKLSSSMIERAIKTITLALKIVSAFLKNCPKKLFSNCLVDGLLTSIV